MTSIILIKSCSLRQLAQIFAQAIEAGRVSLVFAWLALFAVSLHGLLSAWSLNGFPTWNTKSDIVRPVEHSK